MHAPRLSELAIDKEARVSTPRSQRMFQSDDPTKSETQARCSDHEETHWNKIETRPNDWSNLRCKCNGTNVACYCKTRERPIFLILSLFERGRKTGVSQSSNNTINSCSIQFQKILSNSSNHRCYNFFIDLISLQVIRFVIFYGFLLSSHAHNFSVRGGPKSIRSEELVACWEDSETISLQAVGLS